MAGPSIRPTNIHLLGNPIYSATYYFNGGGTQTILTLNQGEALLFFAQMYNYGGTDIRHGDMFYAIRTPNGTPSSTIRSATLADFGNSAFSDNGSGGVQYTAGGGNPATTIYMLRVM